MEIQPQYLAVGKLLLGRLFRIPQYQRAYSWQSKHRKDLFNDIMDVCTPAEDGTHFMATIVGLRRGKRIIITDDHQVIDVVDGQQRLTTLILLIKAIANALDRSKELQERIGKELDETLVKPDKASLLLLQTNHDTGDHFANFLRTGKHPEHKTATTLADRELLLAMEECERFVAGWQEQGRTLADLVGGIKNRLTVIFHEIADESLVYSVFEVLNSRGLDVSWFDRLKSLLMGIAFDTDTGNRDEIITEVHELWTAIYRCVGLRLGLSTESLRFAATLRVDECPNRPLGEADSVELLTGQSKDGPAEVIETTKWLKTVTQAVDKLRGERRLNAVTKISQARLVATAVYLRDDLKKAEKETILRRWENVTFRIYGMSGKDARTQVGNYVRLAWSIANDQPSAKQILDALSEIGADYPIASAVDGLRNTDCYTDWQEELRYLLYRYEEHLAKQVGQKFNNEQWNRIWMESPADSIEHILPQSKGGEKLVHRLGNLIVLPPGLNSKLGAKDPKDKADEYRKCGLLIAQDVVDELPTWKKAAIEEREEAILKWAAKEWAD